MTEPIETDELSAEEIAETAQTDSEVAAVAKMLAELKSTIAEFNSSVAPLKEQHEEFQQEKEAIKQEYYSKLAKIKERDDEISAQLKDATTKMRELQEKAESAERQLLQAVKVKRQSDELARLTQNWDALTIGAPWREYAMPHQDEGAKKMAYARSLVLADVMGLGKTFTAIAACDIIKAKTKDGETWYVDKYHTPEYTYNEDTGERVLRLEYTECEYCRAGTRQYGHFGNVIMNAPPSGRRILYMSPAELVRNVEPEWLRWAPHRNKPIIMAKRTKLQRDMMLDVIEDMANEGGEFVVQLNYEAWRKDKRFVERLIETSKFDTVILDEAHNLKDRGSIAYKGVRCIIDGMNFDGDTRLAPKVQYVFPMTGTPILNRPQELYTLLTLVDSEVWPANDYGERQFLNDYCIQDYDNNKWKFQPGGLDRLAKRIGNRFLRRDLNSAGIKLPPQTIQFHELEIDSEKYGRQAWARKEMREKAMIMIDNGSKAFVAHAMIAVYTRLRQIETWGHLVLRDEDGDIILELNVDESQKLDYLIRKNGGEEYAGLLTEVCPNQRTAVYSQFKEPLHEGHRRALDAGLRSVILDGDTPERVRNEIKIDFDRNRCRANGRIPQYDVVFANYRVGGAGLNLTDVTQTIILDEEWNPGKRDQAYGRTYRIGQTEETTVHVIRTERTIDTWMAGIIEYKEEIVGGFEGSMSNLKDEFLDALRKGEIY
jgi:SNF2 family DNA or RNA helicase